MERWQPTNMKRSHQLVVTKLLQTTVQNGALAVPAESAQMLQGPLGHQDMRSNHIEHKQGDYDPSLFAKILSVEEDNTVGLWFAL